MTAAISFFPVDNGDMTLITTESGKKILNDINIRAAADDADDDTHDVASSLRERLDRDDEGRLFVDVFLLSHPDKDHCTGLQNHFHLGPAGEWSEDDDKIFIREIWSSPMVFRRAKKNYPLCPDAEAFNSEARRRVAKFRDGGEFGDGERILILGEDEDGKTDDLGEILIQIDEMFSRINGTYDDTLSVRVLGPLPKIDDEDDELLSKNQSSTILQILLSAGNSPDKCRYLTGGDAEVAIWERLWQHHSYHPDWLSYDILLTPHHCSWRSLSYDSWSDLGEDAEICDEARKALSQTRDGATIVASSKPIKDDKDNPPCIRAKREYVDIAEGANGTFICVGEQPSEKSPDVLEFEITTAGPKQKTQLAKSTAVYGSGAIGRQPLGHG